MYNPRCVNVNLNPTRYDMVCTCPCLLIKGRERVSETERRQLDTLSSNIWFVWQEDCIKEWKRHSQARSAYSISTVISDRLCTGNYGQSGINWANTEGRFWNSSALAFVLRPIKTSSNWLPVCSLQPRVHLSAHVCICVYVRMFTKQCIYALNLHGNWKKTTQTAEEDCVILWKGSRTSH